MNGPQTELTGRIVSGDRELKQRTLLERVARAASGLDALGLGDEDALALVLRNDFPFFEASMAASALGAFAVPINWHFQAEETNYILRDCGAKVVVAHADLLPPIASAIPPGVEVFQVRTPPEVQAAYGVAADAAQVPPDGRCWSDWLEAQPPKDLGAPPLPATMIYTSGTTGHPKGVRRRPHSEETAQRNLEMLNEVFGFSFDGNFRTVVTGPMYHSAPNAYGLFASRHGGFCVLQPRFDPEELLHLIERHRITHLHMVPTMFVRLLQLPEQAKTRYDLSSLEFVVHAAAPCPAEIKRRMIDWWGPVINEYYGATETGAVVFHSSEEALRKPGTVGRPIKGGTVRIYGDDGQVLGAGEVGEVYLRVDGLPDFTYHGQDARRREIERDGLLTAGDVGYLDEDGYLFLCDRKKDMVISGGVNIYPAEIEAALSGLKGVRDCAVFGIPSEEFGESLCAVIEPEEGAGLSEEGVREYLRGKLARYKIPQLVEFRSDLPREDSGKIFKRKLRQPYWEAAGRSI